MSTRRGVPASALNSCWNCPTECRSVRCTPGGAVLWNRGDSTISQAASKMAASASRLRTFMPPGRRENMRESVFIIIPYICLLYYKDSSGRCQPGSSGGVEHCPTLPHGRDKSGPYAIIVRTLVPETVLDILTVIGYTAIKKVAVTWNPAKWQQFQADD